MMMQNLLDIHWGDVHQAVPAFLTIAVIPLTYSVGEWWHLRVQSHGQGYPACYHVGVTGLMGSLKWLEVCIEHPCFGRGLRVPPTPWPGRVWSSCSVTTCYWTVLSSLARLVIPCHAAYGVIAGLGSYLVLYVLFTAYDLLTAAMGASDMTVRQVMQGHRPGSCSAAVFLWTDLSGCTHHAQACAQERFTCMPSSSHLP
jgi:hypothetical protein